MDRGAWRAAVHGVTQSRTRLKRLSMHACIGEGNGNPFQYPSLENPRDGGAWRAAICGVAQSRTQLKRLSSSSSSIDQHTIYFFKWYKYLYCKTQTILLLLFSREVVSHPFITPWIVARQAPSLHGISQARIWNGLAFPCQGTFPTKELNLILRWQEDSLPLNHQGSPKMILLMV